MLEYMSDVTHIPILLDADTGYGNFNNARRLVRKLEERGVAGACMEDKLFPKTNSLLDGRAQPLADVEEFALKIKACKGKPRCLFIWSSYFMFIKKLQTTIQKNFNQKFNLVFGIS